MKISRNFDLKTKKQPKPSNLSRQVKKRLILAYLAIFDISDVLPFALLLLSNRLERSKIRLKMSKKAGKKYLSNIQKKLSKIALRIGFAPYIWNHN